MRLSACFVWMIVGIATAQTLSVQKKAVSPEEIRGAALARDGRLYTWGRGLHVRDQRLSRSTKLASGEFAEGGCLVDLDGDGHEEFVGKEGAGLGRLTWRRPSSWQAEVIDTEFDTHDCVQATLFGRTGVLVIQRYMQVRFYEREDGVWKHRDIYSIYTPSRQTGLSLRDINGDGRTDIVCGNYWIQSPERFELPWHIFAINTWFEDADSAMLAHAFAGRELVMAQGHLPDARVAVFRRPADPRQLWKESSIAGEFQHVHAVTDWHGRAIFAENNGRASRIFELRDGIAHVLAQGFPVLRLFPTRGGLISVGPKEILLWK